MASVRRFSPFQKGVLAFGLVVVVAGCVWVFQNRETLATACLNTVNGISSKIAHMNAPFGIGDTVQPKNPVLGVVPDFSLTERSGRTVEKSDLLGNFWLASFVFTRCNTSCPVAVTALGELQRDLPESVRLVSFSVDPEHDSPEVLAEYAERAGADLTRWLFLTGEKTSVYKTIREGFHLSVQGNDDGATGSEVTHSPRFALVDPKGRIRGYYDSADPVDLIRLRDDAKRLYNKSQPQELVPRVSAMD